MGTFFLSEERDVVMSGAVLFPADLPDNLHLGQRLSLRFGPQVYAALLEEENNDVMAVSVGAEARFVVVQLLSAPEPAEDVGNHTSVDVETSNGLTDILFFGIAEELAEIPVRPQDRAGFPAARYASLFPRTGFLEGRGKDGWSPLSPTARPEPVRPPAPRLGHPDASSAPPR